MRFTEHSRTADVSRVSCFKAGLHKVYTIKVSVITVEFRVGKCYCTF